MRDAALDARRSFVVQAPAGSGKTGLLIQRYLRLLAGVDDPEEIIAITFTRKAAGEMRERILDALAKGRAGGEDDALDRHERTTLALARAVLARDAERSWSLEAQPARMRILTIDALCLAIATQMPWLSRLGGDASIVEDASPLYRQAAREVVTLLNEDTSWSDAIAKLITHLDGDVRRFESMLVEMLSRRDQWLRYLLPGRAAGTARRAELERELERAVGDALAALRSAVPAHLADELVAACAFAGENLAAAGADSPAVACAGLTALPGASPADRPLWQGIGAVLLTKAGALRKSLTRRDGFPADKQPHLQEMRARAHALLDDLLGAGALCKALAGVARLPEPAYTEGQWQVLDALLDVLPVATACLRVVFAERARVDYSEITNAARQALGADEAPTDLALALDYRIRHILVDEFQDTSHSHFALLQQLTEGWAPDDGRTLFLVGDPMQSIYRFREADVGLFLDVAAHGLAGLPVESLRLAANFRSLPDIVAWVNEVFPQVMSARDDAIAGAVSYTPSRASVAPGAGAGAGAGVCVHALLDGAAEGDGEQQDAREREAQRVAALVAGARRDDPQASVALLVRTRTHLQAILPRLREAGIRYRGVDIEPLAQVPVVEDLMALTRALLHPADRVAWLALLRAPWCGLTLADLHAIAGGDHDTPMLDLLADLDACPALSADGRRRAEGVRSILDAAVAERGRRALRRWVEGAWAALGGPACVGRGELANAGAFFELLDGFDASGAPVDGDELTRRAARLFAVTEVEDADVEVMTIHKAKGLEFDVVIVPSLERGVRADERRLLAWTKRAGESEDSNILLAPVPSPSEAEPPIYDYLRGLEAEKDRHEQCRLLYVAATRARRTLHLLGTVAVNDGATLVAPGKSSLLGRLWPALQGSFEEALARADRDAPLAAPALRAAPIRQLRRVPPGWSPPPPPAAVEARDHRLEPPADRNALAVEFDWAGETARHVGTVVHRALMEISRDGAEAWDAARLARRRPAWRAMLAGLGIPEQELAGTLERVAEALAAVVADERGRWLLDPAHAGARSEFALTGLDAGALVDVVVDRSFVDADGVRWIVDYKSGRHEGGDVDAFLDREQQRYREQLQRYARLFAAMESRPIRLGLYFPALAGWREWSFEPG